MKLEDFFKNRELFLVEQAFKIKDVEGKITALGSPIILHLIKLLKWDDKLNYNKHCRDIETWLLEISKLKLKGNKKPKVKQYFSWLSEGFDIRYVEINVKAMTNYHKLKVIKSNEEVYSGIIAILQKISLDLFNNKTINIEDYLKDEN